MTIVHRRPRGDELQSTQDHIARCINDLCQRHGFGAPATARQAAFQLLSYAEDPSGFCVAMDGDELVGSSFAWSRDDFWFLAELFIAPGRQAGGVGREMLRRALAHADSAGAVRRALITFAFNTKSQGLYMRHGLYSRLPLSMMGVERRAIGAADSSSSLALDRMDEAGAPTEALAALDRSALGVSRANHHLFLLREPGMRAFLLREGAQNVGYAYVAATGHVGPLAVTRRELLGPALSAALTQAARGESDQVSAFIPGASEDALAVAAGHRMRILLPFVLVSDREFGDWRRYMPRNPGFM